MANDDKRRQGGLGGGQGSAQQGRGGGGANAPLKTPQRLSRGEPNTLGRFKASLKQFAKDFKTRDIFTGSSSNREVPQASAPQPLSRGGAAGERTSSPLPSSPKFYNYPTERPGSEGVFIGRDEGGNYRIQDDDFSGGEFRPFDGPANDRTNSYDPSLLNKGLDANIRLSEYLANRPGGSREVLASREVGRRENQRNMQIASRQKRIDALSRPGKKTRFGTATTVGGRSGVDRLMKAFNSEDQIAAGIRANDQRARSDASKLGFDREKAREVEGNNATRGGLEYAQFEETKRRNREAEEIGREEYRLKQTKGLLDILKGSQMGEVDKRQGIGLYRNQVGDAEVLRQFPEIIDYFNRRGEQIDPRDMVDKWISLSSS